MGLIEIDESKCTKEGACVRDCSPAIIRLSEATGFPEIAPDDENACIMCGHCVTVCPHGALRHRNIPFELTTPLDKKLVIDEAQAVQFIRSRRSVRLFKDKPVEKEMVMRLIEVARCAPTAGNSQTVEWLVHTDRATMREIAARVVEWVRELVASDPSIGAARPYLPRIVTAWDSGRDSVLRDAPVLLVAYAPKEAAFGLVDLTIALSHLDLLAPAMGLGTCWAGLLEGALLSSPPLREMVGIPNGYPFHYPMMLGYPAMKHHRLPARKPPKIRFA
jgi:nitroreductase/NAD-dependent dihydropyrimidine dehydrogenase PreA subunit